MLVKVYAKSMHSILGLRLMALVDETNAINGNARGFTKSAQRG